MHPERVLRVAGSMGAKFGRVLMVGCEPTPFDAEQDMQMELSEAVRAAVDPAVSLVRKLIAQALNGEDTTQGERNLASVGASSAGRSPDTAKEVSHDRS
jgi:hypothetical protein